MAHDTHFLHRLERLDDQGVSFALSLYRNVPLVRAIVEEAAPPEAVRVALALGEGPRSPHVLVERSGRFVTCLAAGMPHDLPVISRAAVERAARQSEALRRALEAAKALRQEPDYVQQALKVHGGPRLAREEAERLVAWEPVLGEAYVGMFSRAFERHVLAWSRVREKERLKERHLPDMRRAWQEAWALGHLAGPAAGALSVLYERPAPELDGMCCYLAAGSYRGLLLGPTLRGVWAVTSLGERVVDDLEGTLCKGTDLFLVWASAFCLATIALRWPALRARARTALRRGPEALGALDHDDTAVLQRLCDVVDEPRRALERHLKRATKWLAAHAREGAALDLEALDAPTILASLCYGERTLTGAPDYFVLADALPFVAASSWEELYLPRAVLDALAPERPDETAWAYTERLRQHAKETAARQPPPPPAPPAQGRNEPCACGSGKKHKRCCGA